MECDTVRGSGGGRVERVGKDGQRVEATVPVTGDGIEIAGVYP